MLDNTLSMPYCNSANIVIVDPVAQSFTRITQSLNRTDYTRSYHTDAARKTLQFYRSPAKRNGESLGIAKSAMKQTIDVSVPNASGSGNIVLPYIIEVNFARPVGVSAADSLLIRRRFIAELSAEAFITRLVDALEI